MLVFPKTQMIVIIVFCYSSTIALYSRFQMDLKYGSDIALHFNPRYDGGSGYVMHNTYQNGGWGSEERKYETPFPKGQLFALQILVTLGSYKVLFSLF